MDIYVKFGKTHIGPLTPQDVVDRVTSGQIPPNAKMFCKELGGKWMKVKNHPALPFPKSKRNWENRGFVEEVKPSERVIGSMLIDKELPPPPVHKTNKKVAYVILATILLLTVGLGLFFIPPSSHKTADKDLEALTYITGTEFTYSNGAGQGFTTFAESLVKAYPTVMEDGDVAWSFQTYSDVNAMNGAVETGASIPLAVVSRDSDNRRFTGGENMFKACGVLANSVLAQLGDRIVVDGNRHRQTLKFNHNSVRFPKQLSVEYTAKKRLVTGSEFGVVVNASAEWSLTDASSGRRINYKYKTLVVTDHKVEALYHRHSTLFASLPDSRDCCLVESFMTRLDGLEVVEFSIPIDEMILPEDEDIVEVVDVIEPPRWSKSCVDLFQFNELVVGAVVEGRPNFVVTGCIATLLLVDTVVDVGSTILHSTGAIDWEWNGVGNLAGSYAGLGASYVGEALTKNDLDNEKWKNIGGYTGDIVELLIPTKGAGEGISATVKHGGKAVKKSKLVKQILKNHKKLNKLVKSAKRLPKTFKKGLHKGLVKCRKILRHHLGRKKTRIISDGTRFLFSEKGLETVKAIQLDVELGKELAKEIIELVESITEHKKKEAVSLVDDYMVYYEQLAKISALQDQERSALEKKEREKKVKELLETAKNLGGIVSRLPQVTVTAWDHGSQDGDRVKILLNGNVLVQDFELKNKKQSFCVTLGRGHNSLEIVALNEGSSSPNTASFTVENKDKKLADKKWNLKTNEKAVLLIIYVD